jgi:hypothetical protein
MCARLLRAERGKTHQPPPNKYLGAKEMDEKLLNCPFCGGEAHVDEMVIGFRVTCHAKNCTMMGPYIKDNKPDAAIAAWNRRPSPATSTARPDIDGLDAAYVKATAGEWGLDDHHIHADEPIGDADKRTDAAAIVALHNAYPALRAYIAHIEAELRVTGEKRTIAEALALSRKCEIATIEAQLAAFEARLVSDEAVEAADLAMHSVNTFYGTMREYSKARARAAILAAVASAKVTA